MHEQFVSGIPLPSHNSQGMRLFSLSSHNSQGMRLAILKVWRLC